MKTIAQQLNVKDFPFKIRDKNGRLMYYENSGGYWCKYKCDSNGEVIYSEDSKGEIIDNRPKGCEGKVVEIDGKKYKLTELT